MAQYRNHSSRIQNKFTLFTLDKEELQRVKKLIEDNPDELIAKIRQVTRRELNEDEKWEEEYNYWYKIRNGKLPIEELASYQEYLEIKEHLRGLEAFLLDKFKNLVEDLIRECEAGEKDEKRAHSVEEKDPKHLKMMKLHMQLAGITTRDRQERLLEETKALKTKPSNKLKNASDAKNKSATL